MLDGGVVDGGAAGRFRREAAQQEGREAAQQGGAVPEAVLTDVLRAATIRQRPVAGLAPRRHVERVGDNARHHGRQDAGGDVSTRCGSIQSRFHQDEISYHIKNNLSTSNTTSRVD
jgi:hypothetical protein